MLTFIFIHHSIIFTLLQTSNGASNLRRTLRLSNFISLCYFFFVLNPGKLRQYFACFFRKYCKQQMSLFFLTRNTYSRTENTFAFNAFFFLSYIKGKTSFSHLIKPYQTRIYLIFCIFVKDINFFPHNFK